MSMNPVQSSSFLCRHLSPLTSVLVADCYHCLEEFLHKCPDCGPIEPVPDAVVPVGEKDRARRTLPEILEIKKRCRGSKKVGVFAKVPIELGVYFGPYEGRR